ncbi:hypothetical protein HBH70_228200 [Parastagonospora nodorum]|nr:hypothetical protein HBH70_228200 [Parastagonospora nodorum]
MSYALAASYLFILLSALSFSFCYAVLCVSITKPAGISCFNSSRSSLTKLLYSLGVMLRNKSNEYKGLVNKDLKLLKQKISAGR